MSYKFLTDEALKALLSFKKSRLHQLKADGWFRNSRGNKYSTIECNRRRQEIKNMVEELELRNKTPQ